MRRKRRLLRWDGLLSILLPGLGQFVQGRRVRGLLLFLTTAVLAGLTFWERENFAALLCRRTFLSGLCGEGAADFPLLLIPLALFWLWTVWDALRYEGRVRLLWPILLVMLMVYAVGTVATEVNFDRLVSGWSSVRPIFSALLHPELLARPTEDRIGALPFQVPCIEPLPPPQGRATDAPRLRTDVPCAAMGEEIVLEGEGFFPDLEAEVWWQNPIGDYQRVIREGQPLVVRTDAGGRFRLTLQVPTTAVPMDRLPKPGETQTHRIEVRQHRPYGGYQLTRNAHLVLQKIGETIALAFIATVLAVIFALPVSLLASRNLMGANFFTRLVYYGVRTLLNIFRSIETLIWAIVFAVWVGPTPFAGMLALLVHSVAALGKLYSEAIEGIEPGPIEAVRATGANWLQVVVYAVLPQFMPSFLSFTLYRWDINVRMSTVIGLVSDAGLGFLIVQWIRLGEFEAMATTILAIVLVVAVLDSVSAALRQRIVAGLPAGRKVRPRMLPGRPAEGGPRGALGPALSALRRYGLPALTAAGLLLLTFWSWSVAQVDLPKFFADAPGGLRMLRDFVVPEIISRPTESITMTATLPVPCGSAEPLSPSAGGPRLELDPPCGSPGEALEIRGYGLPPKTHVSLLWLPPGGGSLTVERGCCETDAEGRLNLTTRIRPIAEFRPEEGHLQPARIAASWERIIGGPEPSEALLRVLHISLITLLMALLATTLGSLLAIPLGFLGARNIMGRSLIGRGIYMASRTLFNLWRSVEPLILAVIFAFWIGFGPFAGMISLAAWSIPNLAKLFSETIEEIDPGPVEAIVATGANRLQTLIYAVVPQLVPRFLAYILYQWDINIRMSTVIGFVGAGGIGHQLRLWVDLDEYAKAGTAIWAIVAMVWGMDYVSARARERLT